MTGVVDRLVRRGLARREPDPDDRRRVLVAADLDAIANGPNVYQSIGDAFRRLHESLSTEQLEFLVRYQEDSIALTQEEIERLT